MGSVVRPADSRSGVIAVSAHRQRRSQPQVERSPSGEESAPSSCASISPVHSTTRTEAGRLTCSFFDGVHPGTLSEDKVSLSCGTVPRYTGELWTAKQRNACSLHEVSYRACFKPQLPRFFIERLTEPGERVYDPFSGRGTTAVEAGLLGRRVVSNDINPLSRIFAEPRLDPPDLAEIDARLAAVPLRTDSRAERDLSMFYHEATERELVGWRNYFAERREQGLEDRTDRWIRMVATNRLTGHSPGFFSVYTFPPNQAVSAESQLRINSRRQQVPEYRDTRALIRRKSRQLLGGITEEERERLAMAATTAQFTRCPAESTDSIASDSIALTVTSPPFLDVVQYSDDNWLRCWFNSIDAGEIGKQITMERTIEGWSAVMERVFGELFRITKPNGWVAFEVGEVKNGSVRLDEIVAPLGCRAGFDCVALLVNEQRFTKTANIWGVDNNRKGTNTNRIALFQKP